ncbi:DUF3472 domain-containing protein [Mucilaginibacter sp. X5P1]|uniref:DUF3472 domain-containing protein n=1 Tax=Mucilaginibacter sp. X5P1 TaxID=2723088 RepID=UPI001615C1DD|nr:DUF5077 domain-containing protein [Mucilaginibacter sp. X5P1]MBB6139228.1 hypothetical protein [Mucilaginibacter sp. X5P1]
MIKKAHFIMAIAIGSVMPFLNSCKKDVKTTDNESRILTTTNKNLLTSTVADTIALSNGYGIPDEDYISIGSGGTSDWTRKTDTARVYTTFNITGTLDVSIMAKAPAGNCALIIKIEDQTLTVQVPQNSLYTAIPVGTVNIKNTGIKHFEIIGKIKNGGYFPDVQSLIISGAASVNAYYNKSGYRTCPAVHDGYNIPSGDTASWFYNEIKVHKESDIVNSFFMANGFNSGYFGIQVNSPTERRILFSVFSDYDSNDPNQVPAAYAVQLISKGDLVTTEETFGNEGTGRHAIAVYPWTTETSYKFLVHSVPDTGGVTYTGFIFLNNKWNLIAKYYKPVSHPNMYGLYSFVEDFGGGLNSYKRRGMTMKDQYIVTPHGKWIQLTSSYFTTTTHDDHFSRTDYGNAVNGTGYNMFTGGFVPQTATDYESFTCNPGKTPNVNLPE